LRPILAPAGRAGARLAIGTTAVNASVVSIEDKASGAQLVQELLAEGLHAITRYRPQSDKIMRCTRKPQ
jgi:phage terminase large subunit-like protein